MALLRRGTDDQLLALFEQAGHNAQRTAVLVRDLLADYPERAELAGEVVACEHQGDRLTHDIVVRLRDGRGPRRDPVDAADGYALATALDDVVDYAEQAADWLGLYGIEAPMEQAVALSEVLVQAGGEVARALSALRRGEDLSEALAEIQRLEDEGDRVMREGVASLFVAGIDPMVVIRWKDIFEALEQSVDACETVAHLLEGIRLRVGA